MRILGYHSKSWIFVTLYPRSGESVKLFILISAAIVVEINSKKPIFLNFFAKFPIDFSTQGFIFVQIWSITSQFKIKKCLQ